MSQVFYRIHRPQNFADVIGQDHVVKTLSNQIKGKKLAHAYLFTGPRGVGKTSVARILSRAANCQNPDSHEPDNSCDICQEMINNSSLDLTEIDAASHTGVDNIREIIDHLKIAPTRAKYRTFIIDEVHMLSRGAFNALLKTLEEPPAHVLFILATTEIHKVPATVVSRTQRFDFKKLSSEQIKKHLEVVAKKQNLSLGDGVYLSISQSVDGSMRDALVMLEKASNLAESSEDIDENTIQKLLGITPVALRDEFVEILKGKDETQAINFLNELSENGYNIEQWNRDFLEHLRYLLSKNPDKFLSVVADNFIEAHQKLKISPVAELPLMVAAIKSINPDVVNQKINPNTTTNNGSTKTEVEVKAIPIVEKPKIQTKEPTPEKSEITKDADVEEKWMDVLSRVREYNQSLVTALKLAKPVGAVNGSLTIAFPYKFHAQTVGAAKNRLVIERAVEEVLGRKISIKCILQRDIEEDATPASNGAEKRVEENGSKNSDLLNSAIDVLGGEVVN